MTTVIAAESKENSRTHISMDETSHECIWVQHMSDFVAFENADAFIDFNEDATCDYRSVSKPLLLNQTAGTINNIKCNHGLTARFCGWPGFAERSAWEIAVTPKSDIEVFKPVLQALGKEMLTVNDIPGLIAPRILSSIINEACYAIDEAISDAAQIDTAMKLGTNYPEGPITWGKKIGAQRIFRLLSALAVDDSRYTPHELLIKFLS